jgi:16S rRNA (guanine527-N7)-methyltransferase
MRARLEAIAQALDVPLDAPALDRLMILRGLWLGQGRAINLTGAATDDQLAEHIGDGLATVACAMKVVALTPELRWLDVGSGGGFPALVIAATTPACLTLVEPRQRRAAFLEFALASIGNKSDVIRARLDDATWSQYALNNRIDAGNSPFAVASSRAVFAPEVWVGVGDKLVMEGGWVAAHVRPEQAELAGRRPGATVDWGRSRIAAFLRR